MNQSSTLTLTLLIIFKNQFDLANGKCIYRLSLKKYIGQQSVVNCTTFDANTKRGTPDILHKA